MVPNTILSFRKTNEPFLRKLTDRTDKVDGQTLFHRTLLDIYRCPTRETTKKISTLHELLVGGNRHDAEGMGRKLHVLEDCEVRS